jgi:hypothetical protein
MEITQEFIQTQLADLENQEKQVNANLNAIQGARQMLQHVMNRLEAGPVPSVDEDPDQVPPVETSDQPEV